MLKFAMNDLFKENFACSLIIFILLSYAIYKCEYE